MHFKQNTKRVNDWWVAAKKRKSTGEMLKLAVDVRRLLIDFSFSVFHLILLTHILAHAHTQNRFHSLWEKHKREKREKKNVHYLDGFFHIVKNVNFKLFDRLQHKSWKSWAYASLYLFYSDIFLSLPPLLLAMLVHLWSVLNSRSVYIAHRLECSAWHSIVYVLRVKLWIVALNSSSLCIRFYCCFFHSDTIISTSI